MSFFEELKRRNVVKVAVAYLVSSWVLIQVSETLQELMSLPEWAASFVLFALIIGFPIALIFAWAFELTPEGLARTGDVDEDASVTQQTGQKINLMIIATLSLALVALLSERFFMSDDTAPADSMAGMPSIAVPPSVLAW